MYNKGLFNDWVPKLVQITLIILYMCILMPISGIYTGNITYLVSDTGAMTEYFMMANFVSAIGMGCVMPIVLRLKFRYITRNKLTLSLILLAIVLYVSGTTQNPWIIVVNSLLIGALKMIVSMEFFLPLMMLIPKRGMFYGYLYGGILTLSQLASYYATEYSIIYNWEYFYILTSLVCLILAAVSWITLHNQRFSFKMPLYYIDWMSMLLFVVTFFQLAYVLSFGRQQDWFNSKYIIANTFGTIICFIFLIVRQSFLKRPFLSFKIFKRNNVQHGLFMLLCLGMYMGLGSVQTSFAVGILQYDQLTNAKLNLLMIPGMLVAAAVAISWFKRDLNVKMYVFSGFGAMLMFAIIFYFSMVPEMNYENWYLPMFLKGYGMCALFIGVWFYTMDKIDPNDLLPAFGFVLVWRSFVTIGIFSALFSWLQYQFQIQAVGDLAVYWDSLLMNPQQAMSNLRIVQVNAILVANKKLFGYVIIAGFVILIYIFTHHFGKQKFVELKLMKFFKAKALIARRRKREQLILNKEIKPLKDIGGGL